MTLLGWFRSKDVDAFADALVAELRQRFPPAGVETNARKQGDRIVRIHAALTARIEAFAAKTPLGLYRKARLGNRVKWALMDAGYPAFFVDAFVRELLEIAVRATPR